MPWKDRSKRRASAKVWASSNSTAWHAIQKRWRDKLRAEAVAAYSPSSSCAICGENEFQFLAIDHVDGQGNEHRRELKSVYILPWLRKNKYPPGFRVLCHNCNFKHGSRKQPDRRRNLEGVDLASLTRTERYRVLHPEKYEQANARHRARNAERKKLVLTAYGGKCSCCDEDDIDVLSIDHIYGGGRRHVAGLNQNLYAWLIKNEFPGGFQVLCLNCNMAKGQRGKCPHETS